MLSNWPGQRYRSLSGSLVDQEKRRRYSDASDDDDTPSSDQPMLSSSSPPRKNYALRYHLPRRRFSCYFTLIIASILVLLVVYLVRMGSSSDAQIRMGLKKAPPPPPAWQSFPFLKRYHGGIRSLVRRKDNVAEYPTGDEADMQAVMEAAVAQKKKEDRVDPKKDGGFQKRNAETGSQGKAETKQEWPGLRFDPYTQSFWGKEYEQPVHCYLDNKTKAEIPPLLVHTGIPEGFPDPVMGSYDLFGLNNDVCFERYGRLGPYGFGYSRKFGGSGAGMEGEKAGSERVWGGREEIDYSTVRWAEVQDRCMQANAHRFKQVSKQMNHFFTPMANGGPARDPDNVKGEKLEDQTTGPNGKKLVPRTAIIIRTWKDYQYDDEDLFYLRALMNELSLQSGTEYVIHFLIQVKDIGLQIWADEDTHERALKEALPQEFWGMGTLWSERQMSLSRSACVWSVSKHLPASAVLRAHAS